MPNYSDTIIKIFVPNDYEEHIPKIIQSLSNPNFEKDIEDDKNFRTQWIDFNRLCPQPEELNLKFYDEAFKVIKNQWPYYGENIPETIEEKINIFCSRSSDHEQTMKRLMEIKEERELTNWSIWRDSYWGTIWNADSLRAPEISETCDQPVYYDYCDTIQIKYRITTRSTVPIPYLKILSQKCLKNGLGLLLWYNHEEDGEMWDPYNEQYITKWTPIEDLQVNIEESTMSDKLVRMSEGFDLSK